MSHRTQPNASPRISLRTPDPLRQMHRRLIWALSVSSVALIINVIVVVTLV